MVSPVLRKPRLALIALVALLGLGALLFSHDSASADSDAKASVTIHCFLGPPPPPTRSGSIVHGFGAASCDGPVLLGIKVCIARNGVRWECSPGFYTYHRSAGPAFSISWAVNSTGCVRGVYYSTVVELTAQAVNIAQRTKESPRVRSCG